MTQAELEKRFNHHPPQSLEVVDSHKTVRELCWGLAESLCVHVPESRELSLALTKLEEVMMWSNAGIARYQKGE